MKNRCLLGMYGEVRKEVVDLILKFKGEVGLRGMNFGIVSLW